MPDGLPAACKDSFHLHVREAAAYIIMTATLTKRLRWWGGSHLSFLSGGRCLAAGWIGKAHPLWINVVRNQANQRARALGMPVWFAWISPSSMKVARHWRHHKLLAADGGGKEARPLFAQMKGWLWTARWCRRNLVADR